MGTAKGRLQTWVYGACDSARVVNQTGIKVTSVTGGLSLSGSGTFWCSGKCDGKSGSFPSRTLGINTTHYAVGSVDPAWATGKKGTTTTNWSFAIRAASSSSPATVTALSRKQRCDNAYSGASGRGCVVDGYKPSVNYSQSGAYPEFVAHVKKALNSGLAGSSSSKPLTRETNSTVVNRNRSVACPSSLTRPSGHSCDEYPFASTTQGAASGGSARIFSGCHLTTKSGTGSVGYSRCMINATQNSGAGGVLSAFYRSNRILDGDQFWVKITS